MQKNKKNIKKYFIHVKLLKYFLPSYWKREGNCIYIAFFTQSPLHRRGDYSLHSQWWVMCQKLHLPQKDLPNTSDWHSLVRSPRQTFRFYSHFVAIYSFWVIFLINVELKGNMLRMSYCMYNKTFCVFAPKHWEKCAWHLNVLKWFSLVI